MATALAGGVCKWQAVYKNLRKIPKKSKEMESQGKKPSHREIGREKGKGGKRGEVNRERGKPSERQSVRASERQNFCLNQEMQTTFVI